MTRTPGRFWSGEARIRRRTFLSTAVARAGAAASTVLGAQPKTVSPQWIAVIRVYPSILQATRQWAQKEGEPVIPLEPAHIDGWMQDCALHGIRTVLWRANCAGTLTYPSRFTALAGEPPLSDPMTGISGYKGFKAKDLTFLGKQCRRFNTLEVAVAAAHRQGLKFYLDFSTFDAVGGWTTKPEWPAGAQRTWNPDLWLWSKDQKQRLAGIPCYANELVRRLRVGEIAEALDYGIDGVVLGFFSHVDGAAGEQRCWFGYNPEIVTEYKRRYASDPLTGPVRDHQLYSLHGEYFTQFVREASKVVHAKGKKLVSTTRIDGIHGWGGALAGNAQLGVMDAHDLRGTTSELPLAAGFYLEWEKWAREELVDELLFWAPWERGMELVHQQRKTVQIPVLLFRKYAACVVKFFAPQNLEGYHREVEAIWKGTLDGYCLHLPFIVKDPSLTPDWRELLQRKIA